MFGPFKSISWSTFVKLETFLFTTLLLHLPLWSIMNGSNIPLCAQPGCPKNYNSSTWDKWQSLDISNLWTLVNFCQIGNHSPPLTSLINYKWAIWVGALPTSPLPCSSHHFQYLLQSSPDGIFYATSPPHILTFLVSQIEGSRKRQKCRECLVRFWWNGLQLWDFDNKFVLA